MAHYAFLDKNNIVIDVIVGKNEDELDNDGNPVDWEKYYGDIRGYVCKRTSYNTVAGVHSDNKTPFRKNYAGIGYHYDPEWDAFYPPKPYNSWKLDAETFTWIPPVPRPDDDEGFTWRWLEINTEWVKVTE